MVILINRSAYVEVRDGTESIFRKNKPPNHGGVTGRLLAALGIVETGVYRISFMRDAQVSSRDAVNLIMEINLLDGRKPHDILRIDEAAFQLQTWDKEVSRVV